MRRESIPSKRGKHKLGNRGVSKADWLETALSVLGKEGIDGVKVDRLAKELGIARSGFYWHFRDRGDFHEQLLYHWAHEFTDVVMNNPEIRTGKPRERLLKVVKMVKDLDLNIHDAAVLVWADRDPRARKVFDEVYDRRCRFLRSIFSELGFKGEDLETRTRIFVGYVSWENRLYAKSPKRKRLQWLKKQIEILTRK